MLGVINTVGIKQDEPMQRPALAELFGAVFWATVASLPSDPQAQRVWTASETGAAHGHPFGFSSLLLMAWLVAAVATLGGALGSRMEDDEAVKAAAYSARQRQRFGNATHHAGGCQSDCRIAGA